MNGLDYFIRSRQEPLDFTCKGCVYENNTDIEINLNRCTHCKRAYSRREDREFHKDLYFAEETND